jgi:hypothetical protein
MKEKWNVWLPIILMLVFALSRLPGIMPPNFSAVYALLFCAGVYLPGRMAWWLPLGTLIVTDIGLNLHYRLSYEADPTGYDAPMLLLDPYLLANYGAYVVLIWLGRRFNSQSSWLALLGGGLLGAILFYLLTNTAAWLHLAAYPKSMAGWIKALTVGTEGWPQTWQFFRNTLLSGGLFTALFVGSMKWLGSTESKTEIEPAESEPMSEPEDGEPESAKS